MHKQDDDFYDPNYVDDLKEETPELMPEPEEYHGMFKHDVVELDENDSPKLKDGQSSLNRLFRTHLENMHVTPYQFGKCADCGCEDGNHGADCPDHGIWKDLKSDQAKRANGGKRPAHLAPTDVRAEVDWNYGYGANKYGENDWKKGQPFSQSKACCKRHIDAFESGEEIDPTTGLNHLAAAITNLEMMLFHYWHTWPTRPELDDRPVKFKKSALINPDEREPGNDYEPF